MRLNEKTDYSSNSAKSQTVGIRGFVLSEWSKEKLISSKSVTLQQMNDENPSYIKREYDHKQQVIVGSVIMLCVALAMVFMNNYNPRR